jgi:hypothetical protein
LFNTLMMLGLLAAGVGMMAAALRTKPTAAVDDKA